MLTYIIKRVRYVDETKFSLVSVCGGGGGGSNALNLMFDAELNVIRLRLCNFDIKQLHIFLFSN